MGNIKIPIETSARHVHICREDFEKLFGEGKELTSVKELSLEEYLEYYFSENREIIFGDDLYDKVRESLPEKYEGKRTGLVETFGEDNYKKLIDMITQKEDELYRILDEKGVDW